MLVLFDDQAGLAPGQQVTAVGFWHQANAGWSAGYGLMAATGRISGPHGCLGVFCGVVPLRWGGGYCGGGQRGWWQVT